MVLADLTLVIGLTSRGGTHILYSGDSLDLAKAVLGRAGREFVEVGIFQGLTPVAQRLPRAEDNTKNQAAGEARAAELAARLARVSRFKAQRLAAREESRRRRDQRQAARQAAAAAS